MSASGAGSAPAAGCSPPTQDTGWYTKTLTDFARPRLGGRQGTCEHLIRYPPAIHGCLGEAVVRRQVTAKWRGPRWRDRESRAAWLDDDAQDVRVGNEDFRIVGPGQAIGHAVGEGMVPPPGIV